MPTLDEIKLWRAAMAIKSSPASAPPRRRSVKRVLDLHGYSVQDAFRATANFLRDLAQSGGRDAVVITGRSGLIRREFANWLEPMTFIQSWEIKQDGAFRITLKRIRAFPPA